MSVFLNVYDLGQRIKSMNDLLRDSNLGAFHVGVEVLGDEWCYQGFKDAWNNPSISGIVRTHPKEHRSFLYRESVHMGPTPLSVVEVDEAINDLIQLWPACHYHPVTHNCANFALAFVERLRCPEPFPTWVRGLAAAAESTATVLGFADAAWDCTKPRTQADPEAQQRRLS
jgi:hypothetical protein